MNEFTGTHSPRNFLFFLSHFLFIDKVMLFVADKENCKFSSECLKCNLITAAFVDADWNYFCAINME